MPVPSDDVALGLITAVQRDTAVWVRRAVSAAAWSRCHLVRHWLHLPDYLPSERTIAGSGEPRFGVTLVP